MLTGKSILIISPQSWDTRKVSKHHYATELAKNSKVYFLNPPRFDFFDRGIAYNQIDNNLIIVTFKLPIPSFFKFKLNKIFHYYLIRYLKRLKSQIESVDFLWNFDNATYFKEEYIFKDSFKVFHPVDDYIVSDQFDYSKYDIAFSISNEILDKVPINKKLFINHGLNDLFYLNDSPDFKSDKLNPKKVVYVGNLSIRFLDAETLKNIILCNLDLQFDFVGDYDIETEFIKFLKIQNNVVLSGLLFGKELESKMRDADILLICYKRQFGYLGDNSHKLLEYLSTGNVVVSSNLSVYDSLNLFPMSKDIHNKDYVELFSKVKMNFNVYNSKDDRARRICFAKQNTYSMQLSKINAYLNEVL